MKEFFAKTFTELTTPEPLEIHGIGETLAYAIVGRLWEMGVGRSSVRAVAAGQQ